MDVRGEGACIEEFPPKVSSLGINKTRRQVLREKAIKEFKGLSGDYNIGGTNKVKKMTAYKESAISIAMYLDRFGPAKASQIKKFGCGEKSWQILYSNFYGWFQKQGEGVYAITDKGRSDIKNFPEIISVIDKKLFSEDK